MAGFLVFGRAVKGLRRSTGRKLAALAAVAGLTAVVGGFAGFALGPGGAQTRVGLGGPPWSTPCGYYVPVRVTLLDLEARPSPNQPSVNYGLNAFAFWISYDPNILRVQAAGDVLLNPHLSQVDYDGDGVFPDFTALASAGGPYIDNYSGVLTYAAGSVTADPVTNLGEEGPDPVAEGRSIQLFAVMFLANNAGISPVTVSQVQLGDPGTVRYEPVQVSNTTVTVTGANCPNLPRPTPTPTPPVTPTPTETPTPTATATPEGLGLGPQPVAPVLASEGGRPDCVQGWYVYEDRASLLQVCYPPRWRANREDQSPAPGVTVSIMTPQRVRGEEPGPYSASITVTKWGPGWPVPKGCESLAESWGIPVEPGAVSIGGVEGTACRGTGTSEIAGQDPLQALLPDPKGGAWFDIFVFKAGPDVDAAARDIDQILKSFRFGVGAGEAQ